MLRGGGERIGNSEKGKRPGGRKGVISDLVYPDEKFGEVPERPNGAVSKTVVDPVSTVGSNPTLSASGYQAGRTVRAGRPAV
jgi:hypothetical protein